MEKFIKCPGILKHTFLEKDKTILKLEENLAVFTQTDKIIIAKWKDDLTITCSLTQNIFLLELWKSGKRIKAMKWPEIPIFGTLSACISFYEIEDYIAIESQKDVEFQQFNFK